MKKETITIDKEELKKILYDTLRTIMSEMRQDVRKKICSSKEASFILGMCSKTFEQLRNEPNSKIRRSRKKGKYNLDSIYAEADRLNGDL